MCDVTASIATTAVHTSAMTPSRDRPVSPPLESTAQISSDFPLDLDDDVYFDDHALTPVEKIYLLARSKSVVHRVFISRQLYSFLHHVSPLEAVEYVLPLLNALATDEEESVKEALVSNLIKVMWWFFENCKLIENGFDAQDQDQDDAYDAQARDQDQDEAEDAQEDEGEDHDKIHSPHSLLDLENRREAQGQTPQAQEPNSHAQTHDSQLQAPIASISLPPQHDHEIQSHGHDPHPKTSPAPFPITSSNLSPHFPPSPQPPTSPTPPLLSVQTFTPILGSLLIDPNALVCGPARWVVVECLQRVRVGGGEDSEFEAERGGSERGWERGVSGDGDDRSARSLGEAERAMLEREIIEQVIVGMGRLDSTSAAIVWEGWGECEEGGRSALQPSPLQTIPETGSGSSTEADLYPIAQDVDADLHLDTTNSHALTSTTHLSISTAYPSNPTPADNEANEQAAVGRCASMTLVATVTANAPLSPQTILLFSHEVARCMRDTRYYVRRSAALALGALAKVVSAPLLPRLHALVNSLLHDSAWHVRYAATFALPGILARLGEAERRNVALRTVSELAQDAEPTVRSGVLEVLGEVLYTFHADVGGPPGELVALFVGSGDFLLGAPNDSTRNLITAFNYPAVALALGAARWGEVRAYYAQLARDPGVRVRRTMAAGLGEMARILGAVHAARDVLPTWETLVHDAGDGETRLRAVRGVGMLVQALEGEARWSVLEGLVELWEGWLIGWRERECVAEQLGVLAGVVRGQEGVLRTLLARALVDGVAAVRGAGVAAVCCALKEFKDRPHVVDAIRTDVQALATAEVCRRRATYVECCCALVESEEGDAEVARDDLWETIDLLSSDGVIDVRIGVARLLGVICDKFHIDPATRPGRVSAVVHRLGRDTSHDVRAFVEHLIVPSDPPSRLSRREPSPPTIFAIFSRPPPPPSLDSVTALKGLRPENHRERRPPESNGEGELELGSRSTLDPRPELDECQPC